MSPPSPTPSAVEGQVYELPPTVGLVVMVLGGILLLLGWLLRDQPAHLFRSKPFPWEGERWAWEERNPGARGCFLAFAGSVLVLVGLVLVIVPLAR